MDPLAELAQLIRQKTEIENKIARIIQRPAQIGHVGEYIASIIFDIRLEASASHKAIDGYFMSGLLKGKSVNIKWYGKQEGLLDVTPDALPDTYLVMTGPRSRVMTSLGATRPWLIDHVYLFHARSLCQLLLRRGVQIGVATSVIDSEWEDAEIYPQQRSAVLVVSPQQLEQLKLFSSERM